MIKSAVLGLVLLGVAGAQSRPNLSGVWMAEAGRVRVRIEHNGETFKTTTRTLQGRETVQESMAYTIGQESRNPFRGGALLSRAEWDGDSLVVRSTAAVAGKE